MLGAGHPLFDAATEWAIQDARDSFAKGATLCDPNIAAPQQLWLVRSAVEDGRHEARKRLAHQQFTVVLADHHGLRAVSPATVLNFTLPEASASAVNVPNRPVDEVQLWSYTNLTEHQMRRVGDHRRAECDLRRHYLETTFTDLITELSLKLEELQHASLFGNDDADEREKLQKRLSELKARKTRRLEELELMLRLTANLPDVITSALVPPAPVAQLEETPPDESPAGGGLPMRRDDEIERIAMNVAMRYERSRGWRPFDISADGEHYDIRSEGPDGERRFIEVKGRAASGGIVLTAPERDKLEQLGDRAYLYIVTCCAAERASAQGNGIRSMPATLPRLRIIQDPMAQLHPAMLYRQVQYFVTEADWRRHGDDHDCPPPD